MRITIFVLCFLIYMRIRAIHRELVRYDQQANVHCERRAFGTIAMMLATLGVFFAPYLTKTENNPPGRISSLRFVKQASDKRYLSNTVTSFLSENSAKFGVEWICP